ncbi:MAG: hypothetical protein H6732_17005 [Alphaproteobacteria bacterium]|nr:hypothetical protein [Alphaproteobacteria bacterium]
MCHRAGGALPGPDLRHATLLDAMGVCDVDPVLGDLGLADAKLIAPGHPESSALIARMALRGEGQMPPTGTTTVDAAGVALISAWTAALETCAP